jgi:hypothetical protein
VIAGGSATAGLGIANGVGRGDGVALSLGGGAVVEGEGFCIEVCGVVGCWANAETPVAEAIASPNKHLTKPLNCKCRFPRVELLKPFIASRHLSSELGTDFFDSGQPWEIGRDPFVSAD